MWILRKSLFFPQNMSVRSVRGETYCSKSGRIVTGQIKEKFIILDSIEVLAGSYRYVCCHIPWKRNDWPPVILTMIGI